MVTRGDFGHDKSILLFEFPYIFEKKMNVRKGFSKFVSECDYETMIKVYID